MTIHPHSPSATGPPDAPSKAATFEPRFDSPALQDRRIGDRQATAVSGLAATVFGVASFVLLGTLPDTNDGGQQLTRYITDHRGALLAASITLVLSSVCGVAFFVNLWRHLRTGPLSTRSADLGLAGSLLLFAMVATAAGSLQAAAFIAGRHGGLPPLLADGLAGVFVAVFNLSAAPTLLLAGGFGLALLRTQTRRWPGPTLLLVGACHLGALASVADTGALAPAGAFTYAAPAAYTLWILAISLSLLRSPASPPPAR
jgi:hypothetical protein